MHDVLKEKNNEAKHGISGQVNGIHFAHRHQSGLKLLSMPNFVSLIQPATRSAAMWRCNS